MRKATVSAIAGLVSLAAWVSLGGEIELPATSATITPPFILTNGCILQTVQTAVTNGGRAAFAFTINAPGPYRLMAVVDAPAEDANSFYVNIDSEPPDPGTLWEIPVTNGFATHRVCTQESGKGLPKIFQLPAGNHRLIIRGRNANTRLAHLSLVQARPAPPTGLRIVGGPRFQPATWKSSATAHQ